jgi:hypothetical protein
MIRSLLDRGKMKRFILAVLTAVLIFQLLVAQALAELISFTLNGTSAFAQTYGDPGQTCRGGFGGNASAYNGDDSSIYYLDTWIRQWSTDGGPSFDATKAH